MKIKNSLIKRIEALEILVGKLSQDAEIEELYKRIEEQKQIITLLQQKNTLLEQHKIRLEVDNARSK